MLKIQVDFNYPRVQELVALGRPPELLNQNVVRSGDKVMLWMERSQVEAVLEYNAEKDLWYAKADWTTFRDDA